MEEQDVLFNGKVFTLYSQVGLVDVEIKDAYPQWKTGEEAVVFGLHGVAVATASDTQVDVLVCQGEIEIPYKLCISGEILIGNQGIIVGNVPAASTTYLSLPSGKYSVVIYTDGIGSDTKQVIFCVNRIGSGR